MVRIFSVAIIGSLVVLACGAGTLCEEDVHYTMDYADYWQRPVPPEAISPFEPRDVTYVDEPLLELDSDWNMDVKLFSKYRYTDEFVEKWRAKYGYTPTLPVTSDKEFFDAVDLDWPGLEGVKAAATAGDYVLARDQYMSYQAERARPSHLKSSSISRETGETAVEDADEIMDDPLFPACIPAERFSLWGLMGYLERAYCFTDDEKYAEAWLEMFDHWFETYRPPAQRPKTYISFIWMPYWRTLGAGGSANRLCESECWLAAAYGSGLDSEKVFKVYKSLLEHGRYLYLCNDVYMPSNWQTHQCGSLMKIAAYFPSFRQAEFWREHSWALALEHIDVETYADGTHCENSVGYAAGVINMYHRQVMLARKTGLDMPANEYETWKSLYGWGVKIVPPTGNYVPCGDNGIGADGSFTRNIIVKGALEFGDPTLKFLAQRYPDEVEKTANDFFENTTTVLDAYHGVQAAEPPFTSILLPNTGWAVMRWSWDEESPYLFFDYGWDEAWHSHPDFGSFNIWAFGRPILTECGRGGAYESDLSKRWYKQTIGHNTVMVDSRSMRKCVDNRLNQWWSGERYDFADGVSDGYRWIGVAHNRRVLFVKPEYWIITDYLPGPTHYGTTFQTSGYHEFDWLAHFQPTELVIDEQTKRVDSTNDDANIALVPLNANEVEVRESVGPVSTPTGIEDGPYISLHREGMAYVQYQALLLPYEGTEPPVIGVMALETDEVDRVHRKNVGYGINILGRSDVFLEPGDGSVVTPFGDYGFRGAVAHIQDAGKSEARYLLLNSDYLERGGEVIFSAPDTVEAIEFAVATQAGKAHPTLEINCASTVTGIGIFAPGIADVEVNGEQRGFSMEGDYVIVE